MRAENPRVVPEENRATRIPSRRDFRSSHFGPAEIGRTSFDKSQNRHGGDSIKFNPSSLIIPDITGFLLATTRGRGRGRESGVVNGSGY